MKDYCGCLGCEDKRTAKAREKESRKRKMDEQVMEDENEISSYEDSVSD